MLQHFRRYCLRDVPWLCLLVSFFTKMYAAPIADGADKFLGNIVSGSVPSDFAEYWNQLTLENSGKWGSAEPVRDQMNWGPITTAYDYARSRGFLYKHHVFVWGSQAPGWLGNLSQTDQRAEIEEWIKEYGERYPETDFIDVVNEPFNAPPAFKGALGGDGVTGWDWIVTSFEMARKYCPKAKLLINEFEIEYDATLAAKYLEIVKILKERDLVDGVGLQCHTNEIQRDKPTVEAIRGALDTLASAGVPLYVSELDLKGDDATQLADYKRLFPVFWEHPAVKGVTLWGYLPPTWISGTELKNNGTERPALKWLREYVADHKTPAIRSRKTSRANNNLITVRPSGSGCVGFSLQCRRNLSVSIVDLNGKTVAAFPAREFTPGNHVLSLPSAGMVAGMHIVLFSGERVPAPVRFFAGF